MTALQKLVEVLNTGRTGYNIDHDREISKTERGSAVTVDTDTNGAKTTFIFDSTGEKLMFVTHN